MEESGFLKAIENQAEEQPAAGSVAAPSLEKLDTGDKESVPPDATEADALRGLREAKIAETRKRQDAEKQLSEVKERLAAIEQKDIQRKPQRKELTDEEIYSDIPAAIKRMKAEYNEALQEQRYAMSVDTAKRFHNDYDDVIVHFNDMVKTQPYLMQTVDAAALPALSAYEIAKRDIVSKKVQDPKEIEAKIEAEVAKRLKVALESKVRDVVGNVPPSFASGSSSHGEDEIDDVFKIAGKRKY